MNIVDFIPVGSDNRVSQETLARVLNLDQRSVRAVIKRARESGKPILTDSLGGYFLPDFGDPDSVECDLNRFEGFVMSRCKSAREIVKGVRRGVERGLGRQPTLDEANRYE